MDKKGNQYCKDQFKGLKKWLDDHWGQPGIAFYAFLGCLLTMAIVGTIALLVRWPLLFPSLGPTVILFFERGQRPAAWPRNTLIAHAIAIVAGWLSLILFGLMGEPNILAGGITAAHVAAAVFALALTAFTKHLLQAPHPPSGATTMIISLGFFTTLFQLGVMAIAILLVTIFGWSINRLFGGSMPVWGKGSRSS
ncbi:MAG TPA: HPP family protein [Balneolaceae bacterium]|nr:HPP family protein [Balneolaceae bacterium]